MLNFKVWGTMLPPPLPAFPLLLVPSADSAEKKRSSLESVAERGVVSVWRRALLGVGAARKGENAAAAAAAREPRATPGPPIPPMRRAAVVMADRWCAPAKDGRSLVSRSLVSDAPAGRSLRLLLGGIYYLPLVLPSLAVEGPRLGGPMARSVGGWYRGSCASP